MNSVAGIYLLIVVCTNGYACNKSNTYKMPSWAVCVETLKYTKTALEGNEFAFLVTCVGNKIK